MTAVTCETQGHLYNSTGKCVMCGTPKPIEALTSKEHPPGKVWRCFHCDELFITEIDARNHFGIDEGSQAACRIKAPGEFALLQALRNAEEVLARYRAEDSDALRAMWSMTADHQVALRREEEKGYARGLRDANHQEPTLETSEPPEPTAEMIKQGIWAWQRAERNSTADDVRAIYTAMRRMEGRTEETGAAPRESDWHCVHCGRDNDPSETHCVQCKWSRKHTIAGVLHERGCFDHPCICGASSKASCVAPKPWTMGGDLYGTHRVGFAPFSYARIVEVFGEPTETDFSEGSRTVFNWTIKFADGTMAAIYEYKRSSLYGDGDDAPTPDEMKESFTDWHIGGKSQRAVELVLNALNGPEQRNVTGE